MNKLLSILILFAVTSLESAFVYLTFQKGLNHQSNINVVENFLVSLHKTPSPPPSLIVVQPVLAQSFVCSPRYKNSLVNFLHDKKIDYSFKNRATMAKKYHIAQYRGTTNQNLELLNALKTELGCGQPAAMLINNNETN